MNTYTEDDLRAALAHEADAGPPVVDVWPRLHRGIVVRRWARAGAAVAVAGAIAAVLVVTLPTGHDTVRVTPADDGGAATLVPAHSLSESDLGLSVDILRHRLGALGISGATITTRDGVIDLEATGMTRAGIAAIATRGVLQFRAVDSIQAATSCPPTGSGNVACSTDGSVQYTLGPVALDNSDIAGANAVQNSTDGSWLTVLDFNRAGARKFHTLTADAAREAQQGSCSPPQDCGEIAIVVDGTVINAPTVAQPGGISGGQAQISGAMTKQEAQVLAGFAVTPPLPVPFSVG